jgi:hypothetical protein
MCRSRNQHSRTLTLPSPATTAGEGHEGKGRRGGGASAALARLWQAGTLALLMFGLAAPALALCTQSGSIGASSTAIVGANDVAGIEGRHDLLIQNTGTTNAMNVAVGSSNAATANDLYLGPGASWVMTMQGTKMVPGADVAAISASGTTYSFCDW